MGYLHIDNLYKNQDITLFKECYAMEKIHGTSARIYYSEKKIGFFSGGEKHAKFVSLFNQEELKNKIELLGVEKIVIYGEAYGGKCQGMKDTYGDKLKFIVFDVKIDKSWLSIPLAEEITKGLGLEFVHYAKISTELEYIEEEMNSDSVQAVRNGMGKGKKREGVVLRPLIEVTTNNGSRIIAKHKREDFRETKKRRVVSSDQLKILSDAKAVAEEWVTPMRLNHILDKIENPSMQKMKEIIISMLEDVKREGDKEITWSRPVKKEIGKKTANMTKEYFSSKLKGLK